MTHSPTDLLSLPIVILAGGLGTRLRTINPDRPKPMVIVHGQPFLYWLIRSLVRQGFQKFILLTGHRSEVVEGYPWHEELHVSPEFVREREALGTGGAVSALFDIKPELERCWVLNGDTFLSDPIPLAEVASNFSKGATAVYLTMPPEKAGDGTVNLLIEEGFVLRRQTPGNAFDTGVSLLTRAAVELYSGPIPCSFNELLTPAMQTHAVRQVAQTGTCFDIGTPERFKRLEAYIQISDE